MANDQMAGFEAQLHVALDNMPGALVYTDAHLNIVFCNDQFRKMYPVPAELLHPGQPYPAFLRYLAANNYYGEGDCEALVAQRVESLRNPTGKAFEDRSPDGRWYRILRSRAASWHGHRDDRRDRAEAGGADAGGQGSPASCRSRQYARRAGVHGRALEHYLLQRSVSRNVWGARGIASPRSALPYLPALPGREWLLW
jgi:PAS domain-containing protein